MRKNNHNLWVDAICINQKNLREIYQAAETTIVWFGEASAECDKAMDFLNQNDRCVMNNETDLIQARHYRDEYLALVRRLLTRSWWERIRIVQEVAVSTGLTVECGSKSARWEVPI